MFKAWVAGTGPAMTVGLVLFAASTALACAPERIEPVTGLRPDTPLTLAAADGTRYRLAGLAGDAAAPAGVTRLARLGEADRHGRIPVIAFAGEAPAALALLKVGSARLMADPLVPRPCWQAMEAAEGEAVAARRGLWATPDGLLSATDAEALEAFQLCSRLEGIIPALESSHALAWAVANAPKMGKDQVILVNLSGRGDKDINTVAKLKGIEL